MQNAVHRGCETSQSHWLASQHPSGTVKVDKRKGVHFDTGLHVGCL